MISVPYEVKKALRDGMLRKNYRFVVLNDDGTEDFTIDNDTLVSESVNIDERMCSGDTLKFGLCEGSSLEFQYFDHPNITGRRVQVFVDVFYGDSEWTKVADLTSVNTTYTVTEATSLKIFIPGQTSGYMAQRRNGEDIWQVILVPQFSPQDKTYYIDALPGDEIRLSTTTAYTVEVSVKAAYPIPMGFFDVAKCSRQASTGIMKVTAYNKLQSDYLNTKANNTLLDDFNGDGDANLTVFDIQRRLLADYEITERPKNPIPLSGTRGGLTATIRYTYFSKVYGVDTPLSAYEYWWQSGGQPYPSVGDYADVNVSSQGFTVTLTEDQYAVIDCLKGDFQVFSDNLLNYITDVVLSAEFWRTSSGDYRTRESIQSAIKERINFYVKVGSTTYDLWEDANQKIKDMNNLVRHGTSITIHIPQAVSFNPFQTLVKLYETYTYRYRDENQQMVTKTATPNIEFADGTIYDGDATHIFVVNQLDLSPSEKIAMTIKNIPEFTLRDIVSANYETQCQFGQLDRVTDLFWGVELQHGGLYPAEDLYPADDLYPSGPVMSASKAMYSQLWADEGNVHKWKYLIITYKTIEDGNEVEKTLQRTVDEHGTDNYNMSDNWLFRNLIWTEEQIDDYADAMIAKMQHHEWFPFEMWCAGLPYLEVGDEIEIPLNGVVYTSYVLQRQLQGIQNLQDTYINGTLDIFG